MALQVWFDEKYAGVYGDSHAANNDSVAGTESWTETVTTGFKRVNGVKTAITKDVSKTAAWDSVDVSGNDGYGSGKTQSGKVSGEGSTEEGLGFSFDVDGAWNSVKNAKATSDGAAKLTFKDFVDVSIALGDSKLATDTQYASSDITIENAKRATVSTGAGDDTIKISTVTNNVDTDKKTLLTNSWYDIKAGAGNDTIIFTAGSVTDANDGSKGILTDGNGKADGSRSWAIIDLGKDKDGDVVIFDGVKMKDVGIAHYVSGQDHVYVGNTEVTFDNTGHATDPNFGWIHIA